MRKKQLGHGVLLDLEAGRGPVRFAGRRVLLLDPAALWALRRHLVAVVGPEAARAVLTQFGFTQGWLTAGAAERALTRAGEAGWRDAALRVLQLQGLFTVSTDSEGPLTESGATLSWSFEVEQHSLEGAAAEAPLCWTTCGLLSGYLSRAAGLPIYVLEDGCAGQGDSACRLLGRTRAQWGEARAEDLAYFDTTQLARLHAADAERDPNEARRGAEVSSRSGPGRGAADDSSPIVTKSSAMSSVLDLAKRVAVSEATVLITGESGVGKERVARLVHDWSPRAGGPFVAVNCGAMAEGLLDSELFGHARGAFTGAASDRQGLFEAASGGTLLLDEIGDVTPFMQVKLLRAIQEREIRRVGENVSRPIDVRLLGATNRNLAAQVATGSFRSDLYYRLKVVELHIPPLRARKGDIMDLAETLLEEAAGRLRREIDGFSPSATALLQGYGWPGNVRELENVMERAVALAMGNRIEVEDLPDELSHAVPEVVSNDHDVRPLRAVEKAHILASLESNGGNQTRTAQQLEIGSATLYRKLKRYGALPERS